MRFAGCNLQCSTDEKRYHGEAYVAGFDCDTEFVSFREYTLEDLLIEMERVNNGAGWCILTGGEPAQQVDEALIRGLKDKGWYIAVETNGTIELPSGIDWICVSPKTAFHTIRQREADEFKLVRHRGQEVPTSIPCSPRKASPLPLYVSPAFGPEGLDPRTLKWCQDLVMRNSRWGLSVQQHKAWRLR